jgi:hypothetical protein
VVSFLKFIDVSGALPEFKLHIKPLGHNEQNHLPDCRVNLPAKQN